MAKNQIWLTEESLLLIEGWARDGLTDTEISKKMRISRNTLYKWIKLYPEIKEAIKKGKVIADYKVEDSLFKKTQGYTVQVKKNFKLKNVKYGKNGKKISETEELVAVYDELHIPADTGAIIYWLKCRKADKWNEIISKNSAANDIEDLTPLAKMLGFDSDETNTDN